MSQTTWTVAQLAEHWQCDQRVILSDIRTGRLPAFSIGRPGAKRPTWRITAESVAAYEAGTPAPAKQQRRRKERKPSEFIEYV